MGAGDCTVGVNPLRAIEAVAKGSVMVVVAVLNGNIASAGKFNVGEWGTAMAN